MINIDNAYIGANNIKITDNNGNVLEYKNMHTPVSYELLMSSLLNTPNFPTNNITRTIGEFPFTNHEGYILMFLQLGYTSAIYMDCGNYGKQIVLQPLNLPYQNLRNRVNSLDKPLKFYNSSGFFTDYSIPENNEKPIITASNGDLQYISYYKVEFNRYIDQPLPNYQYDNREYNTQIKFYFKVGGEYFTDGLYPETDVPVYKDPDNIRNYIITEIALVAVRRNLLVPTYTNLLNPNNITTSNFRIYAYKYLDLPLLISPIRSLNIEWTINLKMF